MPWEMKYAAHFYFRPPSLITCIRHIDRRIDCIAFASLRSTLTNAIHFDILPPPIEIESIIYYIYAAHHLDFTTPNLIMLCEEILGETGLRP